MQEDIRYQTTQMKRERILERLKEEGCRITRQRRILLDVILEGECSCCKEIYYRASQRDGGIGMATVYRMVDILEQIGAISRKNMYRIAGGQGEIAAKSCCVELSDHSRCSLSPGRWHDVVRAGMKEYGYIDDQDIEIILVEAGD